MNICRHCRWWKQGLKKREFGVCEQPDVELFVVDSNASFSPHESFGCHFFERSTRWAETAAQEIDAMYQELASNASTRADERVSKFKEIVLKNYDHVTEPTARTDTASTS